MTEREQFEAWMKRPPMKADVRRSTEHGRPSFYLAIETEIAWEKWCLDRGIKPEDQP